jgi:hypothetical protein
LRCIPRADHDGDEPTDREDFVARLATAAYQVALRHGITGSFAKLQLELWHEIRAVCDRDDSMEGAGAWRR